MKHEKSPIAPRAQLKKLIRRKAVAKLTNDMTKLSTLNILRFLYRRHRAELWITGFWVQLAIIGWVKLG